MAQINLDIPDEVLQQLAKDGKNPQAFFQERFLSMIEPSSIDIPLDQRFQRLVSEWRRETRHLSLMSDIVLNTAYQQIVGMGAPAIPLLLKELKKQPDHWFWALRSITGENPILPADRGRVAKMAEAWLKWGREHGYQC